MTIGRAVWIALGALAGVVGLAHVRSPETGFAAAAPSMTADPDATNDEGAPLLQQAMLRQDRGKFRNLLAAGANPAQGNADGQTALHLAAMGKDQYWLDQLLERGVGPDLPNTITGAPPLFDALNARRSENVDRLLAAGARLDIRDRSGKTPLHQAALVNDPVLVLKFLKAGADPRAIDRLGASFQDYLYRSNPKLLNAPAQRRLMAVGGWLQAHGIADAPTIEGVFQVGRTGVYCVKAPCDWRGITKLSADRRPEGRPICKGDELPTIMAS